MNNKSAAELLGNPNYLAISYGGYRMTSREIQPSIQAIKEDLNIMYAMGIRMLRTYNLQFDQAPNILKAIKELRMERSGLTL